MSRGLSTQKQYIRSAQTTCPSVLISSIVRADGQPDGQYMAVSCSQLANRPKISPASLLDSIGCHLVISQFHATFRFLVSNPRYFCSSEADSSGSMQYPPIPQRTQGHGHVVLPWRCYVRFSFLKLRGFHLSHEFFRRLVLHVCRIDNQFRSKGHQQPSSPVAIVMVPYSCCREDDGDYSALKGHSDGRLSTRKS